MLAPIDTAPLFRPLQAELLAVLGTLTPDDWLRPTVAGSWRVRDVAAHLLDGMLRKVAVHRDGHFAPLDAPIRSPQDLTRVVNALNAGGVAFAARLSPRQIVDLVVVAGDWAIALIESLPPHAPAVFAVSWAGEATSENWMDTGRSTPSGGTTRCRSVTPSAGRCCSNDDGSSRSRHLGEGPAGRLPVARRAAGTTVSLVVDGGQSAWSLCRATMARGTCGTARPTMPRARYG